MGGAIIGDPKIENHRAGFDPQVCQVLPRTCGPARMRKARAHSASQLAAHWLLRKGRSRVPPPHSGHALPLWPLGCK
jgi:hypothetical protein